MMRIIEMKRHAAPEDWYFKINGRDSLQSLKEKAALHLGNSFSAEAMVSVLFRLLKIDPVKLSEIEEAGQSYKIVAQYYDDMSWILFTDKQYKKLLKKWRSMGGQRRLAKSEGWLHDNPFEFHDADKRQNGFENELKPYYLAFLKDNVEETLQEFAVGESRLARKCRAYLEPLAVKRIAKIQNLEDRVDQMLPYYLFTDRWKKIDNGAGHQLFLCGEGVGDKLVPIFHDPKYFEMQSEIIDMWCALKYKDTVLQLIPLLEKEDQYWESQADSDKKWLLPYAPDHGADNHASHARILSIVAAVRSFCDVRAKEVLLLTRKRWVDLEEWEQEDPWDTLNLNGSICYQCKLALDEIESNAMKS